MTRAGGGPVGSEDEGQSRDQTGNHGGGHLEDEPRRLGVCLQAFGCGLLLLRAAPAADPGDVHGLAGALDALGRQRAGPALLALVAVGLVGYGVYRLAKARFRRLEL